MRIEKKILPKEQCRMHIRLNSVMFSDPNQPILAYDLIHQAIPINTYRPLNTLIEYNLTPQK
jgi:hypothetical protein